jgi:cardiolipin synthase
LTRAEIIGTGPEFIKSGIRGIEPTTEEIIRGAKVEIQVMVYVFTSNALHILSLLENAAKRGIRITIIVNNLDTQEQVIISKLREIADHFPYVRILNFIDNKKRQLHAKVVIADRKKAIVGSANLSWGGMYSNYEVGVRIEGKGAWKLAELVDSLDAYLRKA